MSNESSTNSTSRPIRLLLVGPMPIEGDVVGGTKISFAKMYGDFSASKEFDVEMINSSRPLVGRGRLGRLWLNLTALVSLMFATWRHSRRADVMIVNYSATAAFAAGPLFWWIAKWRKIPVMTRFFGGDMWDVLQAASRWKQKLAERTFLKSDRLLLQTKQLCDNFAAYPKASWFPTTRELPACRDRPQRPCRKFLFLSQIRFDKGLTEALEASNALPRDCSLSIYGGVKPGMELPSFEGYEKATYYGEAMADEVLPILDDHDVMLFLSYCATEGIPGVVIEALQNGMPVIVADWRHAPEIVGHHVGGIVVPPQATAEVREAMLELVHDPDRFQELGKGARQQGDLYRSSFWHGQLEDWCRELTGRVDGTPNENGQQKAA
ncbi:MAG: glycosyltransferase involved in cell wall biosynthesis [Pirellulaceae bacterium]|jgi:glycosyltransferase involved in cell wall biosynthesis